MDKQIVFSHTSYHPSIQKNSYSFCLIFSLLLFFFFLSSCSPIPDKNVSPTNILSGEVTRTDILLPDLTITNAELKINSKDICANPEETAEIFIQIQNQGNANAGNFSVEVNNKWYPITNGLLHGQITNLWFSLAKEVTISVDVNQEVVESNEENNDADFKFAIPTIAASCLATPTPPIKITNPEFTFTGHTDKVLTIAFSPDGKLITSGSVDNSMRFWLVNEKKLLRTMDNHPFPILSLDYSPNGIYLVTTSTDGIVRIWQVSNGRLIHELYGHNGWVRSLAVSPNGNYIATGGDDYTVRIWRLIDGKLLQTIDEGMMEITDIDFSPDSQSIAWVESDGTIRVRSMNGKWLNKLISANSLATKIAFTSDGKFLLSGSNEGTLLVWQLETGLLQQNFPAHNAAITDIAISHDGKLLATASADHSIKLWAVQNDLIQTISLTVFIGHESKVTGIAFQPQGNYLASCSDDKTIKLWLLPHETAP